VGYHQRVRNYILSSRISSERLAVDLVLALRVLAEQGCGG
jgi:hypothetical protein